MFPGQYDLIHYRGDTFEEDFAWIAGPDHDPVDMTGATLLAQIRATTDRNSDLLAQFTVTNYIPSEGKWTLYLAPSVTAEADWTSGFYDVQITYPGGSIKTLFYGMFNLTHDVSRAEAP